MANDIQSERFGQDLADDPHRAKEVRSPYATSGDQQTKPSGSGCGCWAMGCGGLLVGCILLVVGVGFGGYWFVTQQVEKYTDTEPEVIPVVEMDEQELADLRDRIDSFSRQLSPADSEADAADQPVDANAELDQAAAPLELVLTADQINALIHAQGDMFGRAFVVIEDGIIQAKVSIPADQVPGGKGRFFNADAEIEVSMEEGILIVRIVDATVKGESLPDAFMDGFSSQNLAKEVYDDAKTAEVLRRFESIEVVDDAIVLRLKQPEEATEGEAMEDETTEDDSQAPAAEQPLEEQAEAPLPIGP